MSPVSGFSNKAPMSIEIADRVTISFLLGLNVSDDYKCMNQAIYIN